MGGKGSLELLLLLLSEDSLREKRRWKGRLSELRRRDRRPLKETHLGTMSSSRAEVAVSSLKVEMVKAGSNGWPPSRSSSDEMEAVGDRCGSRSKPMILVLIVLLFCCYWLLMICEADRRPTK